MSREIKFDIIENGKSVGIERLTENGWQWQYFDLNPDNGIRWANGVLNNHKLIRRQYSGLKDKNGKEIYEGDVVSAVYEWETYDGDAYCENSVVHSGEVCFSFGTWRVKNQALPLYDWDKKTLEIIGNIYEHPHLLKQ